MIRDKEHESDIKKANDFISFMFGDVYLVLYLSSDIKKANDFISFMFGDVQFLYIMKFLGGALTLDSFLIAYKASETKGFFPFDNPDKLDFPELHRMQPFH